ncbi:MAG TPA: histidine phosphatase family protein [Capillimicrobium sp.]|jgi:probable phosphoglycerate mutase
MADTPPDLWLARHGDTAWTDSRQHTGLTDIPLTSAGEEAARALAPKLGGREYDLVLSSPLSRARETARLAGFDPVIDDRLREFDYGEYEGITTAQIHESRPDWELWRHGSPGGESADDVGARMDGVVERIHAEAPRCALVFGHGHALRVLAARWLGLPAVEGRVFLLGPAGVGHLGSEHGRAVVRAWGA